MRHRVFNAEVWSAHTQAADAKDTADAVRRELVALRRKTDALALASQAMWELVSERTDLTDADIQTRMQEIDLRDGNMDGKILGSLETCGNCGRQTNNIRKACLYCGAELSGGSPFAKS